MPSTTSLSPTQQTTTILCYYFNSTSRMQLVRVRDDSSYIFSKIVFPQQRILFESTARGVLEVSSQEKLQSLKEIFPCLDLKVT